MPWREYHNTTWRKLKDGTLRRYDTVQRQWAKTGLRRGPLKKKYETESIYSTRFGFLDLYNRNEQSGLVCPSGYNIRQCFGVLAKLWHGYHRARLNGEKVEQMEKYAKAIQDVQKDMGIKTTSFPHLGLYGDVFVLNNRKGERIVFEDHSAMKKQQEEYEEWEKERAENSKKIQEELQKPEKEKQEELESFADDVGPGLIEPIDNDEEEEEIPEQLEPDEEEEEEVVTMTDDIPFQEAHD